MTKEYYIKLEDGQTIPVSEKVYRAYMRPKWREIKQKAVRDEKEFSFEYIEENGMEHMFINKQKLVEQIVEDKLLLEMLMEALEMLTVDERFLIDELYFNDKSEREIATESGVSNVSVNKKHQRILRKIKKFIKF